MATPQLLADGNLDYLVYDYLAEITMSILARARAKNPDLGYATDFVRAAMAPNLHLIAAGGVKVIANAGGVNPQSCAAALRAVIRANELTLKVAVIEGDDLTMRAQALASSGIREMFSDCEFPPHERIASINAYLGAFPIAAALAGGADIVITGRCVDSAVTLGACIHEFGWRERDFDLLAAGSLAGHILECGTQATGGNFTDWESIAVSMADAGYPIAEVSANGSFVCTKPLSTGGLVSIGTVAEQMLYEIGDPRAYLLPDVTCDFSSVSMREIGRDRVAVAGARGSGPSPNFKASATFVDGFRGGEQWVVYGRDAEKKARKIADTALARARRSLQAQHLPDFTETSVEIIGAETHYGAQRVQREYREVQLKVAARHLTHAGIATLFKEFVGTGLAAPPGLTAFAGGRPQPSPVVRLFSFLVPKQEISIGVDVEGVKVAYVAAESPAPAPAMGGSPAWQEPQRPKPVGALVSMPLERLAWGRSGDKGDKANIGIIARKPEYLPYLWETLTAELVATRFAHFLKGGVDRFLLPGLPAINFVLHDVLGGGGTASLRSDPQGKGFAQLLLAETIQVPRSLLES